MKMDCNQSSSNTNILDLLLKTIGITEDDLTSEAELSMFGQDSKRNEVERKQNEYNTMMRNVRRQLMSKPFCRRLKPWPDPEIEGPRVISRAALRAKPSSRLKRLAEPRKERPEFLIQHKFETDINKKKCKSPKEISERTIELSRPRKFIDKEEPFVKPKYFSGKEWLEHLKKLDTFALPKRVPPSPPPPERVKMPLKTILPHLEKLSKPVNRPPSTINVWTNEELNTIKITALNYNTTERIKQLAVPKKLNEKYLEELMYDPRKRFKNSKRYVATERMKELAKPIIRRSRQITHTKDDPYKVNPKALKARCSKRIKELAKPVVRE